MARILVIDDEAEMRELITTVLTDRGHEVEGAANGREGLKCHRRQPADLIISDIMMPEMDGLEIAQALRRSHPPVALIAMSGNTHSEVFLHTAKMLGAKQVLTKPFPLSHLIHAVDALLPPTTPADRPPAG